VRLFKYALLFFQIHIPYVSAFGRYRKLAYKKYHALADDKKADPVLLAEATANKDDVDADFAKLNVKMIQIKLVLGPPAAEGEEAKTL